mmetsp:Transcript_4036/g.7128  ORF Transcript_4036/g.7128 Transcript_4036/m.7128 type:complete len:204 (+) Transcript_4036:1260-1871(+)
MDAGGGVRGFRNGSETTLLGSYGHVRPAPRQGWHARGLGQNGGLDLIAQRRHGRFRRTKKSDPVLRKHRRELRILTRVTPAGPYGIDVRTEGGFDNEAHVGIVIMVGTASNFNELVGQLNVLRVDSKVVGSGHGHQGNSLRMAKSLTTPRSDTANKLNCCQTIVRHKNTINWAITSKLSHQLINKMRIANISLESRLSLWIDA